VSNIIINNFTKLDIKENDIIEIITKNESINCKYLEITLVNKSYYLSVIKAGNLFSEYIKLASVRKITLTPSI